MHPLPLLPPSHQSFTEAFEANARITPAEAEARGYAPVTDYYNMRNADDRRMAAKAWQTLQGCDVLAVSIKRSPQVEIWRHKSQILSAAQTQNARRAA